MEEKGLLGLRNSAEKDVKGKLQIEEEGETNSTG